MNVLSLFDGMGCGAQALKNLGVGFNYFSSEIDKHAMRVSVANHPEQHVMGDVCKLRYRDGVLHNETEYYATDIDLLIGGSPCQSISNLGNGSGLDGKSGCYISLTKTFKIFE